VPLQDGNHIKIGNYLFVFNAPAVKLSDLEESSSTILGVLDVSRPADTPGSAVHPEEKLRHVLEISRKLGESLKLEDVLEKTLASLFKIFPQADRGFVLLMGDDEKEVDLKPRAIKFRGNEAVNLTISRTILNHVLHEGKAILSSDAASDRRFQTSQSILGAIRMMMCVPLLDSARKPGGILQLDTRDDRGKFTEEDLDLLVAVASQVGVAIENARLHAALIEQMQIEQESQDAHEVQLALLPDRRPELPGYEFWDYYEPARYVGGDYFDYLPLAHADTEGDRSPRRWLVAIGDVAGKGMPAALLMARLSAEVRLFTLTMSDPSRIVERLNRDLCQRGGGEWFITFLLVVVDAEGHRISVVNAGHSRPIIRHGDDRLEIIGEGQAGTPLGVNEQAVYPVTVATLEPGDLVLLHTDGLIDAMDVSGRCFGIDRVQEKFLTVPRGATHVGEEIVRAVVRHASSCPQSDDITVLCFGRLAPEAPRKRR
jgi:serine phosphatase RsbU (regulator of sigma subunit)